MQCLHILLFCISHVAPRVLIYPLFVNIRFRVLANSKKLDYKSIYNCTFKIAYLFHVIQCVGSPCSRYNTSTYLCVTIFSSLSRVLCQRGHSVPPDSVSPDQYWYPHSLIRSLTDPSIVTLGF